MFSPTTDPLGINVQARARAARFQQAANGMQSPIGPLPDPQWDGYFQAVDEAADGKPVQFAGSAGPDLGYDTNNGTVGSGLEQYGSKGLRLQTMLQGLKGRS